jgi:hypothetical protein
MRLSRISLAYKSRVDLFFLYPYSARDMVRSLVSPLVSLKDRPAGHPPKMVTKGVIST